MAKQLQLNINQPDPRYIEACRAFFAERDRANQPQPAPPTQKPWPKTLLEQVAAVRALLREAKSPLSVEQVQQHFKGKPKDVIPHILEALVAGGPALHDEERGYFIPTRN